MPDTGEREGVRPLPPGSKCENPGYCDRGGKTPTLLNEEERKAPVVCVFCDRFVCDMCAFGLTAIPPAAFGEETPPSKKASGCYDGFTCSEHFNEDWV